MDFLVVELFGLDVALLFEGEDLGLEGGDFFGLLIMMPLHLKNLVLGNDDVVLVLLLFGQI